ncbi:MAG: alpha/beta fold hydrolase [Desulfobacterales bacterium]|nr:alpha/beta fold hydrolase [Desulfobacterales bacterium]MCP4158627.1 alpha/beta fold hydrolase [Deltaproteobacteria bacterium]
MDIAQDVSDIESYDGITSKLTFFTTPNIQNKPVIVCLPAMGVPASKYEKLAISLAKSGLNSVTADLRGIGKSSVRAKKNNFGYHEMVEYDWPSIISEVKNKFPENQLYLLGHSLGGQLSALYAAINPDNIDGLIFTAACSIHFKGWDFPKNIGILIGTQTARLITEIKGYFPGRKLGFGGTESRQVIRDWSRVALTGKYNIENSPHNFENMFKNFKKPILALSYEGDHFSPEKAVHKLCNKLENSDITYRHLTPEDLNTDKLDHFSCMRLTDDLSPIIKDWVLN